MKVFISWSGERSRLVGELLDDWLQCVLQAIDPWMSSKDIDRGSLWFSEITDQLKDTTIGIILLTQDNKEKPWILFESGALAKGLSASRVCTFLIDLQPTDIRDPLAQFNHTFPNRDGVWHLVRTLNTSLGDNALKEKLLDRVFETYWPQFESAFEKIIARTPDTPQEETKRTSDELLLEVLSSTRSMDRRLRSLESGSSIEREIVHGAPRARESREFIRKENADEIISILMKSNTPPEKIVNLLSNSVPSRYLRDFMQHTTDFKLAENEVTLEEPE